MAGGGEGSGSGSGGCEVPPGQPGLVWEGESEEGVELGLEGGGGGHQGGGEGGPGSDTAMVTVDTLSISYLQASLRLNTRHRNTEES